MSAKNEPFQKLHSPQVRVLWIAGWFGLIAGLGELFIRVVQKFVLREPIRQSIHIIWMAPLADVFLFIVVAFLLVATSRYWPKVLSLSIVVFVFSFLVIGGPMLWFPRLYQYAVILLGLGLAVQSARFISGRSDLFYWFIRRTYGWMLAVVLGMGLTVQVSRIIGEQQALASLPLANLDAPNVLIIILDTVRAKSLSLYGYERDTTPQLERMAKAGVVFENALTTSPWTLPSHASMFTGRYDYELSTNWLSPLDDTYPTLAEVFRDQGYLTSGFVANLLYGQREFGLNRGFLHYEDIPVSFRSLVKSSFLLRGIGVWLSSKIWRHQHIVRKSAEDINRDFFDWLSRKDDKRPFFSFLNYFDAHAPYLPFEPFVSKFGIEIPEYPFPDELQKWSQEEVRGIRGAYEGAIAGLDYQLGLLFKKLEARGTLKNTLVIITSDHGEQFGEHGLVDHSNSLYMPLLHVPLVIVYPDKVPASLRIEEAVSLIDLPATVLDLLGLEKKAHFRGSSLSRFWKFDTHFGDVPSVPLLSEVRRGIRLVEWLPSMKGDMRSLVADGLHYIKNGNGQEELYDIGNDPEEERNLVDTENGRLALARFRMFLDQVLAYKGSSN